MAEENSFVFRAHKTRYSTDMYASDGGARICCSLLAVSVSELTNLEGGIRSSCFEKRCTMRDRGIALLDTRRGSVLLCCAVLTHRV